MYKLRYHIILTDTEFTYFSLQLHDWDFICLEGLGKFKKKEGFHINWLCSGSHRYLWQSNACGQNTSYLVGGEVPVRHYHKNYIKNFKSQALQLSFQTSRLLYFPLLLKHLCNKGWISSSLFNVPESSPKNKAIIQLIFYSTISFLEKEQAILNSLWNFW